MDSEKEKRDASKKLRDEERKREEELKKQADDERQKQNEANLAAISPDNPIRRPRTDSDGKDSINRLLQSGGADMDLDIDFGKNDVTSLSDEVIRSPPKKNARFSNIVQQLQPDLQNPPTRKKSSKQTTSQPTKTSQPKKSSLKTPTHKHAHPRTIVESSIQLPTKKAENCCVKGASTEWQDRR